MIEQLIKKHGKAEFDLVGQDGNAYAIMSRVKRGLLNARWPREDTDIVIKEMMAGDYDHLLQVAVSVQDGDWWEDGDE